MPIEHRRNTPVVEFGLGFGRMDAATRAKDLRKMKRFATGLLLVAAVIILAARWWEVNAGPVWIGYVRAMAEAGMVGRLADWFAVTALPPPAGAPIHTAIIPTKRTCSATAGDFSENSSPWAWCATSSPASRWPQSAPGSARRPTPTG